MAISPATHSDSPDSPDPTDSASAERYTVPELAWVFACFIGGALLRALNLAARPLWDDELTTIITARRPFWEGLYTGQDPQPPLHQWLVRLLMQIKGDPMLSEPMLRLPACAFGIGTILAIWWAARHFVGRTGAAIAVLLVAVNPVLIYHARDARPYSLYAFFAVLSITFFYRLVRRGGAGNVIGYAVTTAGMFFSHYYAMFIVAAQVAFFVIDFMLQGDSRRRFKTVMIGFVTAFILSAPPLILFAQLLMRGMGGAWWISVPSPIEGIDALGQLLGVSSVGVLCLIPLVSAVWLSRSVFDDRDADIRLASWSKWWNHRRHALYLASFVGTVVFLPIAFSIVMGKGAWVARYSIPVIAPMLILGLLYLRRVGPTAVGIVVLLMFALMAPKAIRQPRLTGDFKEEPGLRHAVAKLNEIAKPKQGDTIVIPDWPFADDYQNPMELGMRYYKFDMPITHVNIHELDAYLYGFDPAKSKITKERYEAIKDDPDRFLPEGRTYLLCFRTTLYSFEKLMQEQGRAYKTIRYGDYEDGRHPMYTLVIIPPRGEALR